MSIVKMNGIFNGMSGTTGDLVFVETNEGTVVRQRVDPFNPRTPAQIAARERMNRSQAAYATISTEQLALWRQYAAAQNASRRRSSNKTRLTANNAFNALACKFLQINPAGSIPLNPPTTGFLGDSITVTAQGAGDNVTFTASAANGLHVKTELLLQPLKTQNRTPQEKAYRSKAFVAFATGTLSWAISVPNGWYAPAYRFVNAQTGQETGLIPLPPVEVA